MGCKLSHFVWRHLRHIMRARCQCGHSDAATLRATYRCGAGVRLKWSSAVGIRKEATHGVTRCASARAHRSCTPAPHAPESGELHRARGGKGVRGWLPHPVRTRGGRLAGETHTVCTQNLHVPLATTPGGSFRAPTPARSGALIRATGCAGAQCTLGTGAGCRSTRRQRA